MKQPVACSREALQRVVRHHAQDAIAAMVAVMQDETAPPAARLSAANTLLQWGYGKPAAPGAEAAVKKPAAEQVIRLCWGVETD